jgi:hypothetical protein
MSIKAKTTDKGRLVTECLIHKPSEYIKVAPGRDHYGSGIYILYKGDAIYYVGLSKVSIKRRLIKHTQDKHKEKWDHFSFYHIPKKQYVKDIESILLGIYRTDGNVHGGRLKKIVVHME